MTHNSANNRHEQRPNRFSFPTFKRNVNDNDVKITRIDTYDTTVVWLQNFVTILKLLLFKFLHFTQSSIWGNYEYIFFHIYLVDWLSSLCHVYRVSITNQLVPAIVTVRLNWYDWMCLMLMHIHGAEHSVHCKSYMFVIENNFYWIHHR